MNDKRLTASLPLSPNPIKPTLTTGIAGAAYPDILNFWVWVLLADSRIEASFDSGCSVVHPVIRLPVIAPAPANVAAFRKFRRLVVISGIFSGNNFNTEN
jgi:hypothetical protein